MLAKTAASVTRLILKEMSCPKAPQFRLGRVGMTILDPGLISLAERTRVTVPLGLITNARLLRALSRYPHFG